MTLALPLTDTPPHDHKPDGYSRFSTDDQDLTAQNQVPKDLRDAHDRIYTARPGSVVSGTG